MRFLANKDYLCIVSIVAHMFLRDELKNDFKFLEVYLHTSEVRARENFSLRIMKFLLANILQLILD